MRASFNAFEKVYRRELPFVWATARRLGVSPAVIDDAVQDVFLTAYRRWDDVHHDVSPRAWLYGVTRRVAFRYRRTHARTVRRKAAVVQEGASRETVPHREREEAYDVDAVLAVLEPKRREVFVMAELLEMTAPEIASQLEIPVNTVYSRLRLARRELEPHLRRGVGAWAGRVKAQDRPPAEQAQRCWVALTPLLGKAPGGVVGAWSMGRLFGVAVAAGVVVVAVVAARPAPRNGGRGVASVETRAAVEAEPKRGVQGSTSEATTTMVAVESDAAARVPVQVAMQSSPDKEVRSVERRRSPARAPDRDPAASDDPSPARAGLEDEVAVLDRATAALRGGDAAHALQWLAEHERRFPKGRLADVRKATRVRALCQLGRDAQARAEAAVLRREHPGSNVARKVPLTCDEQ